MKDDSEKNDRPIIDPIQYRSLNERLPASNTDRVPEFSPETMLPPSFPSDEISRRRFLGLISASAALATGTSCTRIDRGTIIPYTRKPEETIPGVATYYASTFQEGLTTCGVLVKTREGRPIHVEGNPEYPLTGGKINLRAIGDVLGLYDLDRLRGPSLNGRPASWSAADEEIAKALKAARNSGRPVLLLTEAVVSPSRKALIEELRRALPTLRHVAWEPGISPSKIAAAQALYGAFVVPQLHLDRAEVILSLAADFLGVDGRAGQTIHDFSAHRAIAKPSDFMNRLWVVEGAMTLTGANADQRLQARPSKMAPLVFALAAYLHESLGIPFPAGLGTDQLAPFSLDAWSAQNGIDPVLLRSLGEDLKRAGKNALILAGPGLPPEAHIGAQLLNHMLSAEGNTLDIADALPGPEILSMKGMQEILAQAAQGSFAAAIFWGSNPAYAFPDPTLWKNAAAGIPMKIRIGLYEDETALDSRWRLSEHHWLESWGDFSPDAHLLSLRQPTIGAIHDTRQGEDILLAWLRELKTEAPESYLAFMKARWQKEVYPAGVPELFENFWNASLHDGVLKREAEPLSERMPRAEAVIAALESAGAAGVGVPNDLELWLTPGNAIFDGRYANNGWLNELPDPVTKTTWGNPLLISMADAARYGLKEEDVVRITCGERSVEVPIVIQPGQCRGVVSLALGSGRRTGNVAGGVGVNAYVLMDMASSAPHLRASVKIERTGGKMPVRRTQEHHRMEGRNNARSWTTAQYAAAIATRAIEEKLVSLIPSPAFPAHKWGMAIDLSGCVGCSACVVACQSENNIPVVGPERVSEGREMHWIRIDRYYEGDPEDPKVLHQPVLCQHCDNAPCEIVCPVNATTHSPDGLNQMTYNRCVGTRYCSNNCPYKVRRFNFFDYTSTKKAPENLVFNPEVTVRPRGVMEKCSFCIQRIQDVRQRAQGEKRPMVDGEIRPACAAACPADAIVFGDLNDAESRVSRLARSNRGYRMLEELGVKPAITYLTDISNPFSDKGKA